MAEPKKGPVIKWYRTPLDRETLNQLSRRSNFRGFAQTLSYLGLYALSAGAALYGFGRWPIAVVIAIVFVHGMICSFMINGVHELGHGTVFKTKFLNEFFVRVLAFLSWMNFVIFGVSHSRHHAYTLHQPEDLEVVLPIRIMVKHFFQQGFVRPLSVYQTIRYHLNIARGKFSGTWELALFPETDPEKRRAPIRWARTLLIGHGLILAVSIYFKLWLLPVLFTLSPFFGGWLFFLCNNTQHVGLQDGVPDFRLNCRTFTANPLVRLLYWQMNFHTEHHMYPTVPCYRLGRLHQLIKYDLPPCPNGLIATWREIGAIMLKQQADPTYQHHAAIPSRSVEALATAST